MRNALRVLQFGIGTVMVVYGASQVIRPQGWYRYVPGFLNKLIPVPEAAFMRSHGVLNIGLGVLFAVGWRPVYVSYATLGWWLSIMPFAFYDDWHSGMRDFAITAGVVAAILLIHDID